MRRLEAAIITAEMVRDVSVLDCNVIVCDRDAKILHCVQAKSFHANIQIGEVASGGVIKECIAARKITQGIIPERVYGITLKAIIYPIIEDDGSLSGIMGTATSMKMQEVLHRSAQSVVTTSKELAATTEKLAASASRLADNLESAKSSGESVLSEISKTDEILKFVSDVANNSNLLGINAAIEAAHAGEMGRGFAVVADEIRKMAVNSTQSVKDIRQIIQNIKSETKTVVDTIVLTSALGDLQATATGQIQATMQELAAAASEIEKVADVV